MLNTWGGILKFIPINIPTYNGTKTGFSRADVGVEAGFCASIGRNTDWNTLEKANSHLWFLYYQKMFENFEKMWSGGGGPAMARSFLDIESWSNLADIVVNLLQKWRFPILV